MTKPKQGKLIHDGGIRMENPDTLTLSTNYNSAQHVARHVMCVRQDQPVQKHMQISKGQQMKHRQPYRETRVHWYKNVNEIEKDRYIDNELESQEDMLLKPIILTN